MGPQCGGKCQLNLMPGIWDFVQQSHNFIASKVSLRPINAVSPQPHTWQTRADRVIDGPRLEEKTDFLSYYTTGAVAHFIGCDCCRVVVAGHADRACARADRS